MSSKGKSRVVVAMSGGVDSSVAAALLVEQGYDVVGMMLRLWSEEGTEMHNRCCTPAAMALARRVSAHLEIPFYTMDVRETFRQEIVQYFLDGYTRGVTPNPCLMCNRHIRFGALLNQARTLDADFLATGHYARLKRVSGFTELYRGIDRSKDQSYVLSVLNQQQLTQAMFPVGEFTKTEVRALAEKYSLPTAQRSESMDLCFLAGGDYREFLTRHAPQVETKGQIVDPDGNVLGEHEGLAFYTIGQRKGLGIAPPKPHYVIEKNIALNQLTVGTRESLGNAVLIARQANWLLDPLPTSPFQGAVQIRSTSKEKLASITVLDDDSFKVAFDLPLRDITPGQAAVIYDEDRVIGFGIIETSRT